MSDNLQVSAGHARQMGATLTHTGCNFAVHAPAAEQVQLCLFQHDTEEQQQIIPLPAKTGKIWHGHVNGIKAGQLYNYRVKGSVKPELGQFFDEQKLLIDPYAKRLNRPMQWSHRQYEGDSQFMLPKAVVCNGQFDWQGVQRPYHALSDTVIYEAHVKGLSMCHPQVPTELKGKFLGVCHPAVIKHLQSLGVSAIQLLPVAAFMPEPYIAEKGLTNYWGYNPINFFAPDARYAIEDGVGEFKTMVRELHRAGIEVILDVVYNHTAEGGFQGPTLSFKGFDAASFYLYQPNEYGAPDFRRHENNSGCGNSVNSAHPYAMKLIMDALRYWVQHMGVDGFRFDLAASLGRDTHEFRANAGILRAIRQDPVLQSAKLIAEPWDIGHGGYRLGQFSSNWQEVNDKYRDTVRAFWRGDKGLTGEFATRLLGSRDVFPKGERSIHSSVNNITYHDGFTLHDMVSYAERHNEANLEQNRDGHGHNLSANYGHEGPSKDPKILALRQRQKRNLFATLMLSQGIPHMLGGDELGRTQKGNNNAYCQDNEISWFDWEMTERKQDFLAFCQHAIKLRRDSELLSQLNLEDDNYFHSYNCGKVAWYRPDGQRKVVDDWHDVNNQAFAVAFKGECQNEEHWLLVFNASEHNVLFQLPKLEPQHGWHLRLDTRYDKISDTPDLCALREFEQAYRSITVFQRGENTRKAKQASAEKALKTSSAIELIE